MTHAVTSSAKPTTQPQNELRIRTRNYLIAKTLPGRKAESYEPDASVTCSPHHSRRPQNEIQLRRQRPADPGHRSGRRRLENRTQRDGAADRLRRPARTAKPKVTYNGDLKPTKVVNRRGKETTYGYDLANQLTEVINARRRGLDTTATTPAATAPASSTRANTKRPTNTTCSTG